MSLETLAEFMFGLALIITPLLIYSVVAALHPRSARRARAQTYYRAVNNKREE